MATISTSQTLDSAARTAGEAMTINSGAILTINTHTRFHANAPASATGSLGSYTMTAASGGQAFIDGQSVRMVAYSTGTGNVPAYNTSITQGGVTGVFLCAMATLATAPTAVGAAMPATGYIMFKSVSGGAFAAGALAGIGATVVGTEHAGFLEIVVDDAASFTVGRAQSFKTSKQWFYPYSTAGAIVTTSGSRGQQIQLPTFGGANSYYPGIWIETGVGTDLYEFWPAMLSGTGSGWALAAATAGMGTDARSKFVQCLASGIIRIGSDGTNNIGDLPVSGCRVRIPNIIGWSCATASRASNSVPNATLATRPDFTTTNAGVIDVDGLIGHWQMNFSQAYSVKLWNVALFDQYTIAETATALDLDNCHNGNYVIAQDAAAILLTSNFAGGTIANSKFGRTGTIGSADYGINVQYCNNLTFTNCHFQNRTFRTNAGAHPFYAAYCDALTFNDCVVVGASAYFLACTNTTMNDTLYADSYNTTSSATTPPVGVIQLVGGALNTVIDGFGWYTSVANVHPDTAILYLSAAYGVKVRNIGTYVSPLTAGASNAMLYFCNDAGNSQNIKFQRVYLNLVATTFYNAVNSSKNVKIENCEFNTTAYKNLVSAALNQIVKNCGFAGIAPAATASIYGSSFYHHFYSTTQGRLGLKFSEPTAEYAPYVTTNFTSSATGTSGFNSSQGMALVNSGDYAIFEWPHTIIGIDSFQNVAPTVTTATNMVIEYQIDTGAGYGGTWLTFNATNLSGTTVDEVAGFKFKIKARATATAAANILTEVYCLTNSNATAQALTYPLDQVTLTLTGLPTGCDITILDAGTETVRENTEDWGGTSYAYTYADPGAVVDIVIIKPGYMPSATRGYTLSSSAGSLPFALTPDPSYLE